MASTEDVSAVQASDSPAPAARDNTPTTTTPEHPDVPAPAPSSSAAAESAQLGPQNTESESKEKSDTEDVADKSSPSEVVAPPAATTTPDHTTTAAVINVTSEHPSSDVKSSEAPVAAHAAEGEASDQTVKEAEDAGPELVITLLLTTGARHPFKIDRKYLRRRSVKVENDDPFNMSVYTLKELIWREWRAEWEPQPSSPSSIRLISFGKLLDDKSPLSESSLTHDAPNVIHMTVKPQEVVDEEDAKGGKSYSARDRDTTDRSPSCRCIIL